MTDTLESPTDSDEDTWLLPSAAAATAAAAAPLDPKAIVYNHQIKPLSKRSPFPTRNNKAGRNVDSPKRPPLLVSKASDLPPPAAAIRIKQDTTHKESTLFRILWKWALKKNNLILAAGVIHQLWRARFLILDTVQTLATNVRSYQVILIRTGKWMLLLSRKREQRQLVMCMARQKHDQMASMTLGLLFNNIQIFLTRLFSRLSHLNPWTLLPWDSLILAIISLTITRYLLHPKTWI